MFEGMSEEEARQQILDMVGAYCDTYHGSKEPWQEGDFIPYAARVYDHAEMESLVDASLEFWLTAGQRTEDFEKKLGDYLGVPHVSFVNSGSSANLLAFMALTSSELGDRAIKRGDEIITVAAGFPTTIAPCVQFGVEPVFVDVTIPQYNVDVTQLEAAYSPRTKAVMLAHTLGNPFDIAAVKAFCDAHDLWLIEDNCDALGSTYTLDGVTAKTGTFGDIGTSSFYPPHHMTTGEGGAVYTGNAQLHRIIRSLRDWGRDCACESGQDDRCGHRWDGTYGELPKGYDHKYVYSHFGYNLNATDLQAAIGLAQLDKLDGFVAARKERFSWIEAGLTGCDALILPQACPHSDPSWFGYCITCEDGIDATVLTQALEARGIQTRRLFAGNIVKHPCFDEMRATGKGYRCIGDLPATDRIMRDTFWIGTYPGMSEEQCAFMARALREETARLS